jgi:hypothetical protein
MAVANKVNYGKAEAGGYRVYLEVIKNGKSRIAKSQWFKTEAEAKRKATGWKRMYQ